MIKSGLKIQGQEGLREGLKEGLKEDLKEDLKSPTVQSPIALGAQQCCAQCKKSYHQRYF